MESKKRRVYLGLENDGLKEWMAYCEDSVPVTDQPNGRNGVE